MIRGAVVAAALAGGCTVAIGRNIAASRVLLILADWLSAAVAAGTCAPPPLLCGACIDDSDRLMAVAECWMIILL